MNERGDGVVTLTLFVPNDASVLCNGDADPELRRRFDFPPDFAPSLTHSVEVIARWHAERAAGTRFPYAVRSAATNELLGGCELRPLGPGSANISYWTYPTHRGRGVATRALRLACEIAFTEFGFRTLEAMVEPDNAASRKVALANGFVEIDQRDGRLLYVLPASSELLSTPRLLLVPASPQQLRALIRRDYVLASTLIGSAVPQEWPDHSEAREGLPWHLAAIDADPLQSLWRIRFVVEKASNTLIGSVNLKGPPSPSGEVEIGWGIVAAARRRGFAAEASGAVVDWVFATNRVRRIVATVPETNVPSQRVALRLGMTRTSETLRGLPIWAVERHK